MRASAMPTVELSSGWTCVRESGLVIRLVSLIGIGLIGPMTTSG
jgi:hypothetical protein